MHQFDAVIVGSGPNGLAAGIKLAQSGYSVKIFEAKDKIGGGLRSSEIIAPGYLNDICSAIHLRIIQIFRWWYLNYLISSLFN